MTKKVLDLANLPAREPTVSQETLDATPARVITFLRAIGTVPVLRRGLEARGYTTEEHRRGWALLQASSGYDGQVEAGGFATRVDPAVRDAIAAIDAWDEDGFRIVRAALGRLHPEQAKTVLAGLSPSTGAAAILGVETLLDRLDALAKSKHADDRAAIATLEARGLSEVERKRLRALVKVAKEGTSRDDSPAEEMVQSASTHQRMLVELRAWYEDWSEMARVTFKRRDHLLRLGLAQRRVAKKAAATPAVAPTVPGKAARGANGSTTAATGVGSLVSESD
ncbi:hypothetical protein AKJ09_08968 [Labilithrix luteola]|uniref:Uncharacterized protein n=1 Tax=Labilithrix luteola TaxID=1391654 RepID=A0A0K1QA75_9BACT|nr:hypothetical protein [Labilithrix luteola]AKV02305.1 hypothetical protein AKJ09_08968 [Labilithrix luteola]